MRDRPPDEGGPPRGRNAGDTENVLQIYPKRNHDGVAPDTQGKPAHTLATDPWLPIRQRTLAACTLHRMHYGLPVHQKLTAVYRQRRRQLAATLWAIYR